MAQTLCPCCQGFSIQQKWPETDFWDILERKPRPRPRETHSVPELRQGRGGSQGLVCTRRARPAVAVPQRSLLGCEVPSMESGASQQWWPLRQVGPGPGSTEQVSWLPHPPLRCVSFPSTGGPSSVPQRPDSELLCLSPQHLKVLPGRMLGRLSRGTAETPTRQTCFSSLAPTRTVGLRAFNCKTGIIISHTE